MAVHRTAILVFGYREMTDHLMTTYARQPITFARGEGAWLWDEQDKQYLDAIAGIAVCSLGHSHPAVTDAICRQAGTLLHTSNLYQVRHQQTLADELCKVSGMERVFFSNSGAEANEAAIKIARLYGHKKGVQNPQIIVCEGSFHGRTLATLSATGNRKIQAGFEPLVTGFLRVPYNDLMAIENIAKNSKEVVAILVEPVQGEGGVNVPAPDYLHQLRQICDRQGWLLMLDEIQTGMGRTGQWFAFQHQDILPDVVTLAKALGNGFPIGACLAQGEAAQVFQPGNHGTTFGGNPLATATALAVVKTLTRENLVKQASDMGEYLLTQLRARLGNNPAVANVRGLGMMLGIELDRACGQLVHDARAQGLLINVTADKVIRLLPPLIIDQAQADQIIDTVCQITERFLSQAT